jgi:hypothetical protein
MAELRDHAPQILVLVTLDHAGGNPPLLPRNMIELPQQHRLTDPTEPIEEHAAGVDAGSEPGERHTELVDLVVAADERRRAGAGARGVRGWPPGSGQEV